MIRSCDFCGTTRDGEKVDKKAGGYVCSACVQLLLNMLQEKLARAHDLAVKRGCRGKARAIQSFLLEVPSETQNTERNMVRARPSRAAGSSRNRNRA